MTSVASVLVHSRYLLVECIDQHYLTADHGSALKIDDFPMIIVQIGNLEHCGVDIACQLREKPLKVGKEGRVIECPFRCLLKATR